MPMSARVAMSDTQAVDDELTRAALLWSGRGTRAWPHRDDQALVRAFGEARGLDLLDEKPLVTTEAPGLGLRAAGTDTAAEAAYRAAIELGDAHAHNNLAVLLLGAHNDVESSAMHFRLAISGGDTLAIANLRDLEND